MGLDLVLTEWRHLGPLQRHPVLEDDGDFEDVHPEYCEDDYDGSPMIVDIDAGLTHLVESYRNDEKARETLSANDEGALGVVNLRVQYFKYYRYRNARGSSDPHKTGVVPK